MKTPAETVDKFVEAINRGRIDDAMALYEPNAALVTQEGKLLHGKQVREVLERLIALKPGLHSEAHGVFETGEQALYISHWSLRGKDPSGKEVTMTGESTDVLHRQPDGRWLIAIDNPWGVQPLRRKQ